MGHVVLLSDCRSVKALQYGELEEGSRKNACPFYRYKDTNKVILRRGDSLQTWKDTVTKRPEWPKSTYDI